MLFIILNLLSVLATFILAGFVIYFILDLVLGWVKILDIKIFDNLKLKHLVFNSITILLFIFVLDFHLPW